LIESKGSIHVRKSFLKFVPSKKKRLGESCDLDAFVAPVRENTEEEGRRDWRTARAASFKLI